MIRPEIVSYLQDNLKKYPVDELRRQLYQEGVSDADFDEALAAALRNPQARPQKSSRAGAVFLAAGGAAVTIAALVALSRKPPASRAPAAPAARESAFVGRRGYVLHLPKDYTAVPSFKDSQKAVETIYFCKAGTDPTNFLDEGLYGQLGIVRLETQPSAFAGNLNGLEALTRIVSARIQQRGEKFTIKNLQVSSLRGIQINYDTPFPRVEAYILGDKILYLFAAGQDDEIYREIVTSLRDTHAEN